MSYQQVCNTCKTPNAKLKCSSCLGVHYCGNKCQQTDWYIKHKYLCPIFSQTIEGKRRLIIDRETKRQKITKDMPDEVLDNFLSNFEQVMGQQRFNLSEDNNVDPEIFNVVSKQVMQLSVYIKEIAANQLIKRGVSNEKVNQIFEQVELLGEITKHHMESYGIKDGLDTRPKDKRRQYPSGKPFDDNNVINDVDQVLHDFLFILNEIANPNLVKRLDDVSDIDNLHDVVIDDSIDALLLDEVEIKQEDSLVLPTQTINAKASRSPDRDLNIGALEQNMVEKLIVPQLKSALEKRDLSTKGRKADLVERLNDWFINFDVLNIQNGDSLSKDEKKRITKQKYKDVDSMPEDLVRRALTLRNVNNMGNEAKLKDRLKKYIKDRADDPSLPNIVPDKRTNVLHKILPPVTEPVQTEPFEFEPKITTNAYIENYLNSLDEKDRQEKMDELTIASNNLIKALGDKAAEIEGKTIMQDTIKKLVEKMNKEEADFQKKIEKIAAVIGLITTLSTVVYGGIKGWQQASRQLEGFQTRIELQEEKIKNLGKDVEGMLDKHDIDRELAANSSFEDGKDVTDDKNIENDALSLASDESAKVIYDLQESMAEHKEMLDNNLKKLEGVGLPDIAMNRLTDLQSKVLRLSEEGLNLDNSDQYLDTYNELTIYLKDVGFQSMHTTIDPNTFDAMQEKREKWVEWEVSAYGRMLEHRETLETNRKKYQETLKNISFKLQDQKDVYDTAYVNRMRENPQDALKEEIQSNMLKSLEISSNIPLFTQWLEWFVKSGSLFLAMTQGGNHILMGSIQLGAALTASGAANVTVLSTVGAVIASLSTIMMGVAILISLPDNIVSRTALRTIDFVVTKFIDVIIRLFSESWANEGLKWVNRIRQLWKKFGDAVRSKKGTIAIVFLGTQLVHGLFVIGQNLANFWYTNEWYDKLVIVATQPFTAGVVDYYRTMTSMVSFLGVIGFATGLHKKLPYGDALRAPMNISYSLAFAGWIIGYYDNTYMAMVSSSFAIYNLAVSIIEEKVVENREENKDTKFEDVEDEFKSLVKNKKTAEKLFEMYITAINEMSKKEITKAKKQRKKTMKLLRINPTKKVRGKQVRSNMSQSFQGLHID